MAKKFVALRDALNTEAKEEIIRQVEHIMTEMPLHELRRAKGMSQKVLAENLHVQQLTFSQL
jgi:DNA-binding transcriptional regulator YiaG